MELVLVRHGETEWSRSRRHTGRTDLALTASGRDQAVGLRPLLADLDPRRVLSSPLRRALQTASLAGFGDHLVVDDRLAEWDYGEAEGLTTAELRERIPGWSVWTHDLDDGEALGDVAARVDSLLADLLADALPDRADGPGTSTILFAHAHLLRILAARWCGLAAAAGAHFVVDPASVSVLGFERETRCVLRWNQVA
ncbi:MAG: histidine phosphatase family protein [Acidimicrobiales bacterium]|nr:histidine phosphatase family protein [Acidimicrobiales bacterium]